MGARRASEKDELPTLSPSAPAGAIAPGASSVGNSEVAPEAVPLSSQSTRAKCNNTHVENVKIAGLA